MNKQNQPVLRSRRSAQPATAPTSPLDEQMAKATAIARAGAAALPQAYRDKPGAVLLAMAWADARDVDYLTALQTITFIGGRPFVGATMQRALAEREGYRVVISDVSPQGATATVLDRDGAELGAATYTWEDADRAGLTRGDNYRKHPADMLVARATTQAVKRYAPQVLLGLRVEGDDLETEDVLPGPAELDAKEATPTEPTEPDSSTVPEPADAQVVDAEAYEWGDPDGSRAAGIKQEQADRQAELDARLAADPQLAAEAEYANTVAPLDAALDSDGKVELVSALRDARNRDDWDERKALLEREGLPTTARGTVTTTVAKRVIDIVSR